MDDILLYIRHILYNTMACCKQKRSEMSSLRIARPDLRSAMSRRLRAWAPGACFHLDEIVLMDR